MLQSMPFPERRNLADHCMLVSDCHTERSSVSMSEYASHYSRATLASFRSVLPDKRPGGYDWANAAEEVMQAVDREVSWIGFWQC